MDYYFIGDSELVTAFRFVGVEGTAVLKAEEALTAFRRITGGWSETAGMVIPGTPGCKVLILTEETADWIGEELTQWQLSGRYPLVVELPGLMGRLPGRKTLVDAIREAIGVRV